MIKELIEKNRLNVKQLSKDVMDRIFKIATWNANKMTKHSQIIKTFIYQNVEILFVFEMYFTNKSISYFWIHNAL